MLGSRASPLLARASALALRRAARGTAERPPAHGRALQSCTPVAGRRAAKIATRKGAADKARAKVLAQYGKRILMLAKQGGADPVSNAALGALIAQAKKAKVPAELIDRNLKKASDDKAGDLTEVTYEAYGHGGVGVVCEALTDNLNRTVADFREAVKKTGGKVAESGSVLFNFERKGIVRLSAGADEDEAFMVATDAGAEDLKAADDEEGAIDVVTEPGNWASVADALREAGLPVDEEVSGLKLIPLAEIDVSDEDAEANEKLLDRLLDLDDIDVVTMNQA